MSRKKIRQRIDNSLTHLVAGVRAATVTGGSYLSGYNSISYTNNYSLITLNRIVLTYLYCGNGIFQTAIQLPVQDAISRGMEIESGEMDAGDIEKVMDFWDRNQMWNVVLDAKTWARLYGGGAVIINSNQDPETPLNLKGLQRSPFEFYDLDRWQIDTRTVSRNDLNYEYSEPEFYYLSGLKIHSSRVKKLTGKRAPSYIRKNLRGWALSDGERMIRDLNLYLKTQDVLYEILDESKVDVYKINGLANKLMTTGGTESVQHRIQMANELKNYVNALVLDQQEEFDQKTIAFAGLAEVMRENRIGVASALRMPVTKLFGLSASGFNTGESDLENYNSMVESEVRMDIKPVIRWMLDAIMTKLFGYVPSYRIKFPPLRLLSAVEEEQVKTSHQNRLLSLYDRGLLDSGEIGDAADKAGLVEVETKAAQGILPPQPEPPAGGEYGGQADQGFQAEQAARGAPDVTP